MDTVRSIDSIVGVPATPSDRQRPRVHTGQQVAEIAIFDATEALLAQESLHSLSVAQIIKAADVSRASFYHYFSSKFEVVATLMARIFDEIYSETHTTLEARWDDPGGSLRASLGAAMAPWHDHRAVIHATLENMHAVPALAAAWATAKSRFAEVLVEQITRERAEGRAPAGLAPEAIAELLVGSAERIFYVGSSGVEPRLATPDQRLDAIVSVVVAAIYGTPAGPAGVAA
jgi:AcrR family transcriptional regulator